MIVTCFAFGLFILGFAIHLILWRIHVPKRQSAELLLIFFAILPLGLAATKIIPPLAALGPWGFWQCHVALFHVAMTLAYVVTYSALEERSPSMSLLTYVADSQGQGRTHDELSTILRSAMPVEIRLNAMIRDKMVEKVGQDIHITPKGNAWVAVFSSWRKFSGLKKGG